MIRLDKLTKIFETPDGSVTASNNVDMVVPEGEVCILLGPSGCGKTTTLKMINRLIPKTSGKIYINGRDTDELNAVELRRNIGYVIQQIGLFPNMTIEANVCAVPDLLGWDKTKSRKRTGELLEMVNLKPSVFLKRYPKELSGGQQQRVGVVRALAADPPVLLMDEPFGAIDPINREVIQNEFLKMQAELKKTIIFVSHDIDEAVKMADKVAIFLDGNLEQYDSPDDLLAHPATDFIANFLGSDRTLKRLGLLKVSDAMDAAAPKVVSSDSLKQATTLMKDHGYKNLAVVGPLGKAKAFVKLNDIQVREGLVEDHCQSLSATANIDDNLRETVSTMFRHDVQWLACVDNEGHFEGYITQRGIGHVLGASYRDRSSTQQPEIPRCVQ